MMPICEFPTICKWNCRIRLPKYFSQPKRTSVANSFQENPARTGQNICRCEKNLIPCKNNIFLAFQQICSKCDQLFPAISESKSLKCLVFYSIQKGKVRGNKTVSKFGPFSELSGKIRLKFCRCFVRPLTFLLVSF